MIFIQPSIDPILISLGFLDIRWYSLSYIFTFIFGSILIKKLNKKSLNNLSDIQIDKFFVWAVLGVIIGGRVGYVVFYQLQLFFQDPYIHIPDLERRNVFSWGFNWYDIGNIFIR